MAQQKLSLDDAVNAVAPQRLSLDEAIESVAPQPKAPAQPQVKGWIERSLEWLPTIGGATGMAVSSETGPGMIAGGAVGGMVGEALRQGSRKLLGYETDPNAGGVGPLAGETAKQALGAAAGVATGAAIPIVGTAMRVGGEGMSAGADALKAILSSRDPITMAMKYKVPALKYGPFAAKAAGKAATVAGRALEKIGEPSAAAVAEDALKTRLARIPLQGRLASIPEQGAAQQAMPAATRAIEEAGIGSLSDDLGLVRESLAKGVNREVALRIVANGDKAYYDVLKEALGSEGLPAGTPQSVLDLLRTSSFRKLPQP